MPKYIVMVHERWVQPFEVEADNPKAAQKEVASGGGTAIDNALEYVEQLGDPCDWTVEESED